MPVLSPYALTGNMGTDAAFNFINKVWEKNVVIDAKVVGGSSYGGLLTVSLGVNPYTIKANFLDAYAKVEFGNDGTTHQFVVDITNGIAVSIPASRVRVTVYVITQAPGVNTQVTISGTVVVGGYNNLDMPSYILGSSGVALAPGATTAVIPFGLFSGPEGNVPSEFVRYVDIYTLNNRVDDILVEFLRASSAVAIVSGIRMPPGTIDRRLRIPDSCDSFKITNLGGGDVTPTMYAVMNI